MILVLCSRLVPLFRSNLSIIVSSLIDHHQRQQPNHHNSTTIIMLTTRVTRSQITRSLSTTATTSSANSCPHLQKLNKNESCPRLREVPTLPLVGSMIPQYSGTPKFTLSTQYSISQIMRQRFGNFIKYG